MLFLWVLLKIHRSVSYLQKTLHSAKDVASYTVIFRFWAAEVEARRQSPLCFKEIFREANIAKKFPLFFWWQVELDLQ